MDAAVQEFLTHFAPGSAMFEALSHMQGGISLKPQLLSRKAQMLLSNHPHLQFLHPINSFGVIKYLTTNSRFHTLNQVSIP